MGHNLCNYFDCQVLSNISELTWFVQFTLIGKAVSWTKGIIGIQSLGLVLRSQPQVGLFLEPVLELSMHLPTAMYVEQSSTWPDSGQHILAHHDQESIVVYQAYQPSIGRYAVAEGKLGGPDFSFSRMSWIKPNFLWMMYRSGWGTKKGQEMTLGLRIKRSYFDQESWIKILGS